MLLDVLRRAKFATRLGQAGLTPQAIVDELRRIAVFSLAGVPHVASTDPDDDHVIDMAIASLADLITAGNKRDLLPLGSFQGISIVHCA